MNMISPVFVRFASCVVVLFSTPALSGPLLLGSAAGSCSAEDQTLIKAHPGTGGDSFGKDAADCGKAAYGIFSGFNRDTFTTCLRKKISLSAGCADCYAGAGAYGAGNCKWPCLTNWCSKGCMDCAAGNNTALAQCTGFPATPMTPCS